MVQKIPAKLYKFQTYNDYSIQNLKSGQIWFSKPEGLNDPFDCAIPIIFASTDKEIAKFVKDYYIKWLRESGKSEEIPVRELQYLPSGKPSQELKNRTDKILREKNRQRVDEFSKNGVACFTTELKNILMWSHYAAGHKGFCLEFDTNYFPFHDQQKLNKVVYSNSYPTYPHVDIVRNPLILNSPLKTKSKDWKYEKEWRLIMKEGNSALKYDSKALTAIYFGCSMLASQKTQIASLPTISTTRLFNMKRSETKFILELESYT